MLISRSCQQTRLSPSQLGHNGESCSDVMGFEEPRQSEPDGSTPPSFQPVSERVRNLDETSSTHPRRIPRPLVLSSSSNPQPDCQPEIMSHNDSHMAPCMDATSRLKLPSSQSYNAFRSKSAQHVRLWDRHSCPRTPLRSAGPSNSSIPTVRRRQGSETGSESSFHSSSSPPNTCSDITCTGEEIDSPIVLTSNPLDSEPTEPFWSSNAPTTVSLCSVAGDTCSIYSDESGESKEIFASESPTPIARSSIGLPALPPLDFSSLDSDPDPSLNLDSSSWAVRFSIDHDRPLPVKPLARLPSLPAQLPSLPSVPVNPEESSKSGPMARSTSIKRNRTPFAVVPSTIKEPTKTIQAKRSFGQLILFRNHSQTQTDPSQDLEASNNISEPHERDEEKEELEIHVDHESLERDRSKGHLRTSSHSLSREFRSLDSWNQSYQSRDHFGSIHRSGWASTNNLGSLEKESSNRDSSYRSSMEQSRESFGNRSRLSQVESSRRGSVSLEGPRRLLKLVKSHSNLRETFFRPKQAQRSQSVYHAEETNANLVRFPGSSSDLTMETGQRTHDSFLSNFKFNSFDQERSILKSPFENEKRASKAEGLKNLAYHHPASMIPKSPKKNNPIHHSSPLTLLKFWTRKKTPSSPNLKKHTGSSVRTRQISSPVLIPVDPAIQSSEFIKIASWSGKLSNNPSNNSDLTSNAQRNGVAGDFDLQVKTDVYANSPVQRYSLNVAQTDTSLGIPMGDALNGNADVNLSKPSRPPRKRPIMTKKYTT